MDFSKAVFLGARKSDCVTNALSHSHAHYELNFLTSGDTRMKIGDLDIEYNSCDFILIPPKKTHLLYESKRVKFDNYVIWFEIKNDDRSLNENKVIKLHDFEGSVRFLCSEIYHLFSQSNHKEDELINIYLQGVLYHMKQGVIIDDFKRKSREDEILETATQFINANIFRWKMSVVDVANELGISSSYLSRIFQNKLGIPPMQYIIEVKLSAAKDLLKTSNLNIKQISERLLFSDPLYFSKVFSKSEGISPKEYMKIWTNISSISKSGIKKDT